MERTMVRHRPIGVSIISIILAIQGIVELIIGITAIVAVFALGGAVVSHGHTTTGHVLDALGAVLGSASIIIGVLTLIFAFGLWTLRRWAFWLTVIIEFISLIRHLLEFAHPNPPVAAIVIGLILPVIILLYFLADRNVRDAFRVRL